MYGRSVLFSRRSICSVRNSHSGRTKKLLEFLAEMPKANSARIAEAQRQRQNISKKSEKYGPSSVYLQVLGSGARGAPNTLYLFTDQKRYLFNCGECTQRLAHEHKVKLSKLDHIFITTKTWRNIGGLPGLSLTLQDVGVPNITLHGPEGLDELYQATRRFVIMKDMNVTMAKCSPTEDFEDNVMTVKYVLLGPLDNILTDKDLIPVTKKQKLENSPDKQFEEFIHDETDYYKPEVRNMEAKTKNVKDKEKNRGKPPIIDPVKKKTEKVLHELQKKVNPSVAYICTLKKRLGTLDLAKCVERGVKPGPLLGLLKSGQDVVLPDGTLVLSKDVKTPDDPGPVFIVLDIPDISYLKESEFSAHFDSESNPPESVPTLIVHFTPPHVFHDPQYRAFMAMFGPDTQHLILNNQNSCLGSEAVHRTQHKLHLLDPDIFPQLRDVSVPAEWNSHPPVPKTNSPVRLKGLEELKNKIALAQFQNIISLEGSCRGDGLPVEEGESAAKPQVLAGRTLTMFHLRPKKEIDRSAEPKLHIQEYIQETMDMDGFAASLDQFRRLVESIRYAKSESQREYPKIVFLGTGSCIPSKTRNTSAIVLHIDEDKSMLMDCGEGTFGQLVRFYGPKKVNAFLRTLNAIYISHLHADHHIGLIGVLQARREAFEEAQQERPPLHLLAPGQIVTWLTLYDQQFEKIRAEFTLIPNQVLIDNTPNQGEVMTPAVLASIGVQQIRTCLVAHCPNAFGVAIEMDRQNKITYSGDTLPCEELVKIGENSTLLIHEATMEDELADEARTKMHSTTSQAIEIGRQMNARFTVLTHFSQRYARLPRLNAHILNDNTSVGIAFDNMQITMSDLELLPHMYAPLQLMFAEHCVELELKAAQRQRTRERRPASPPSAGTKLRRTSSGNGLATAVSSVEERKNGRGRWVFPGCRTPSSAPVPQANYLESHASMLRQELKGMAITGIVRNPGSRSISASPPKSPRRSESRQKSGDTTPRKCQEEISVKSPEVPLSRATVFETGNFNAHTQEHADTRSKMTYAPSSGIVVDTRSKTLNSFSKIQPYQPPTGDEAVNLMTQKTNKIKCNNFSYNCSPCNRNGFGKPLVTPLNKKLMIRKETMEPSINTSSDRLQSKVRTISQSQALRKEITPLSAIERPRNPSQISPSARSIDKKIRDTSIHSEYQRVLKVMNVEPRRKPGMKSTPQGQCYKSKYFVNIDSLIPYSKESLGTPPRQSLTKMPPVPKQGLSKDMTVKISSKPKSAIHSNKSFKPQLEDIKSSYLLLTSSKKRGGQLDHDDDAHWIKPFNDEERRKQLMETKRKFLSRRFMSDSRYDKIEGLNWIPWK